MYSQIKRLNSSDPLVSTLSSGSGAAWLARLPWEQEVGGSNPLSPIASFIEVKTAQLDGSILISVILKGSLSAFRNGFAQVQIFYAIPLPRFSAALNCA